MQSSSLQAICVLKLLMVLLLTGLIVESEGVQRGDLFSFANDGGDMKIIRNDDDNTNVISPSVPYTFLGRQRSSIYVRVASVHCVCRWTFQ